MKFVLFFAVVQLWAFATQAHIVASPDNGAAGSYFQTSLRVAHGCEDSETTELRVKLPEGITTARPQAKPGWTININKTKLEQPMEVGHGKTINAIVTEIIWTGNTLPADQYDDFGLLLKLPDTAGKTLWFPVTQICKNGRGDWVGIPAQGQQWHDLQKPAPFIRITDKTAH